MNLIDHKSKGKGAWLTSEEIELLLNAAKNTEQKIAFGLGSRCGLRSQEVVDVTPADIVDTGAGHYVRVQHGKGDQYRETPLPNSLKESIMAYSDVRQEGMNIPLIQHSKRTYRRWVKQGADRVRAATGDDGWKHISTHDLRRSWGGLLVRANVEHGLIMEWGGWNNWETFREHYLGRYTPEHQRKEREKVDWL